MKILDKYLIRHFLSILISSFLIAIFILVMQALWLYFDDIAGKGIGISIILEFLWYMCLFVMTQALSVSVLLSSIITIGSFGENYEFAAIKSAGVSFFRVLSPLIVIIFILSILNFFFTNYIYPYASFRQKNLLLNIQKTQPALALVAGSFNNEIPNYSIKFDEKYGKKNNFLKNVFIINTKEYKEDRSIITAKSGELTTEEGSKYITLILKDGYYFEDLTSLQKDNKLKMPASFSTFDTYIVNMDISDLSNHNIEEERYKFHYTMKNIKQLKRSSDSLKASYDDFLEKKFLTTQSDFLVSRMAKETLDTVKMKNIDPIILNNFDMQNQKNIMIETCKVVENDIKNAKQNKPHSDFRKKILNSHDYQIHYILMSSISCLLLFFIGASLGSIIKKGGFGFSMVVAIIVYVSYHFTNTFGKNVTEESKLTAFLGGWLGTLIMLPFAVIFTILASRDMKLIKTKSIFTFPFFKRLLDKLK